MENKVTSLDDIYNQIQEMMDDVGIGTVSLFVEGKVCSYQHVKEGKYKPARRDAIDKSIRVSILREGHPTIITADHWSPTIIIATIRMELEKLKLIASATDNVEEMVMTTENITE